MIIRRRLQETLQESLSQFPVVAILGARQTGKTTLAKEIVHQSARHCVYMDLELPSDLNKIQDPEFFLEHNKDNLVILDEIQRKPELFPILRGMIDKHRIPGRFLILGSASPHLIKQSSETLAGRIVYHEMSPFVISEIGAELSSIQKLWIQGGYPSAFLTNTERSNHWLNAYIRTFLEREIPQLGFRVAADGLRKFWIMLSHYHSQLWNASQIANNLDITAPTVRHLLSILEQTYMVRILEPYFINISKRLVKSPKVYMCDSGILHAMLNLKNYEDVLNHPILGHSWEGFVVEQIIRILPNSIRPYFYRTQAGAEIDIVLTQADKPIAAIEIKHSSTPNVSKGFIHGLEDLSLKRGYIIYPGYESYPLNKSIQVISIDEIPKIISEF